MEQNNNNNQINIELTEEVGEGIYANLAIITHSPTEFVLDYVRMMPNMPKAKVVSRIVLTPQNAKRLLAALSENITRYESQFGAIKDNAPTPSIPPINFGPR